MMTPGALFCKLNNILGKISFLSPKNIAGSISQGAASGNLGNLVHLFHFRRFMTCTNSLPVKNDFQVSPESLEQFLII